MTWRLIFPTEYLWIAAGFAVSTSIVGMQLTRTTHPPGGATALIAVMSPPMKWAGYLYVLMPVLSGALVMLLVALIVNNITRRYPLYWW